MKININKLEIQGNDELNKFCRSLDAMIATCGDDVVTLWFDDVKITECDFRKKIKSHTFDEISFFVSHRQKFGINAKKRRAFDWFKKIFQPKTDQELLAEHYALANRLLVQGEADEYDLWRYEKLTRELVRRGFTPKERNEKK